MTRTTTVAVAIAATLAAAPALAQSTSTSTSTAPHLHVNDRYQTCFFDLHPELTPAEFRDFAAELAPVLRFRELGSTPVLRKGRFESSLQFTRTPIDDSKGAWNNTMSHPAGDHYLGDAIALPRLALRYGVGDGVDVGAWGSLNPKANYGLVGVDTRMVVMRQSSGRWVTLSLRPSLSALVGPSELVAGNVSVDLAASRAIGPWTVTAGVAAASTGVVETSNDVDLDPVAAGSRFASVGLSYHWRGVMVAAEIERGRTTSYGFRLGKAF